MDNARYKVLLIEDDKIDQDAFTRFVEDVNLPFDFKTASSISEGQKVLACEQFDIVISDYNLGDGTGFDVLNFVKDTPVIIVTGTGDEEIAVRAMKAGASDYLIKDHERNYLKVLPVSVENVVKRREAEEKLKMYDRLKNELAVTVSQELRTSLGIFKGIISDAMAGRLGVISAQLWKNLEIADKIIDKLAKIISDFLDISKIETGNVQLRKTKVDIQEVVSESIFLLTSLAEEKKIKLLAPFPCDPSFTVYADHGLVRQILVNLFDNTVKFSPMGSTIRITVRDLDDEVQINMQDTSDGIGSEDISKVFNNFIQSDKYAGPGSHGIGLGLYVAKQLIVAQGGRVWAESTPGQGSIFCLALPKYSGQIDVDYVEPVEIVQKS